MFDYSSYAPEQPQVAQPPAPPTVPPVETGGGRGPQGRNLLSLISRIEEAIVAETAAIRADPKFDINAANARKGRYLYELNKAIRANGAGELGPEHRERILRLQTKLDENRTVIMAHLDAVKEVADMIKGAIQRAEADGTYSDREFGRAGAR